MSIEKIQQRINKGTLVLPRISQTTVLEQFETPERAPEGTYYGVALSGTFSDGVVAAVRIDAEGNADYHITEVRNNRVYMGACLGDITHRYTFRKHRYVYS